VVGGGGVAISSRQIEQTPREGREGGHAGCGTTPTGMVRWQHAGRRGNVRAYGGDVRPGEEDAHAASRRSKEGCSAR
jgi:hypothetical protein